MLESLHPSVRHPVHVSDCVHTTSPEPLNHFSPILVWWCIFVKQYVVQKNWFTIFSVKVTVRAYVIKI